MKFRPLHDRIVVRRVDAEEKTKGGIIIPDTAKEKPQEGEVIAVGPGGRDDSGKLIAARCQGRRPDPVRQMVGNRDQARWRRTPHHEGERRHGRDRERGDAGPQSRLISEAFEFQSHICGVRRHVCKGSEILAGSAGKDDSRDRRSGERGARHAGSEGPQCRDGEELRRAAHHQGRRHRRQGNRTRRQI